MIASFQVQDLLKWPLVFLGVSPLQSPSVYSLITYAGHSLGTWYPEGGIVGVAKALGHACESNGIDIRTNTPVTRLNIVEESYVSQICSRPTRSAFRTKNQHDGESPTKEQEECVDVAGVVASADYHFVEQVLLPPEVRVYDQAYWDKQIMSPSCLIYHLGVKRKLPVIARSCSAILLTNFVICLW